MAYPDTALSTPWVDDELLDASDMQARVTDQLNAMAASWSASGKGGVGHNVLGSPVTGITTAPTLATVTVSVVAGRKYRVSSYFEGGQVTTTGNALVEMKIAGVHAEYLWFIATPPETIFGKGNYYYVPGSSGSVTFLIAASTSAGTLSISAGAFILVEDIGTT